MVAFSRRETTSLLEMSAVGRMRERPAMLSEHSLIHRCEPLDARHPRPSPFGQLRGSQAILRQQSPGGRRRPAVPHF